MNNNILYLQTRDFGVDDAPKGKVLVNNQKGVMFCMFHADLDKCQYCADTMPEWKKLAIKMPGVKFGLCNLNHHRGVWEMSRQTFAPIDRVPYILLYVNGRPLMRYDGEKRADVMMAFLNDVINRLNSTDKKGFFENKNVRIESDIPTFTNTPQFNVICDSKDGGVCYLDSGKAYVLKK